MNNRNILLISPHTDDELFGAGGTLLKLKDMGCNIKLVVMSCASRYLSHLNKNISRSEQWNEFCHSAEFLSTEDPLLYDIGEKRLEEVPVYKSVRWLDSVISEFSPDVILLPEPSYHQEHKITYEVSIASVRPTYGRKQPSKIFTYEIPTATWSGSSKIFFPNVYCCIDDKISQKVDIFKDCYKLQYTENSRIKLGEFGLTSHARYRGIESGYEYAEAFMLLRGLSQNGDFLT